MTLYNGVQRSHTALNYNSKVSLGFPKGHVSRCYWGLTRPRMTMEQTHSEKIVGYIIHRDATLRH